MTLEAENQATLITCVVMVRKVVLATLVSNCAERSTVAAGSRGTCVHVEPAQLSKDSQTETLKLQETLGDTLHSGCCYCTIRIQYMIISCYFTSVQNSIFNL